MRRIESQKDVTGGVLGSDPHPRHPPASEVAPSVCPIEEEMVDKAPPEDIVHDEEEVVVRQADAPRGPQHPPELTNANNQSACCLLM